MSRRSEEAHPLAAAVGSGLRVVQAAIVLGLVAYALSGIRVIQPTQVGLVLRFGRLVGGTPAEQVRRPGLLLAFPRPIDRVVLVPIKEVREVVIEDLWSGETEPLLDEFGMGDSIDPVREGYCITGDRYIVQPRAVVKYQISDPIAYALRQIDPSLLVRDASMTELTRCIGGMTIDKVLAEGKKGLAVALSASIQKRLDLTQTGVSILRVELPEVVPTRHVIQDFKNVQSASIQSQTMVRNAQTYRAQEIPKAEREANQLIKSAQTYRKGLLAGVTGEVARFEGLLKQYKQDPQVVRGRLFREAMEEILAQVGAQYLVPKADPSQKQPTIRLLLPPKK